MNIFEDIEAKDESGYFTFSGEEFPYWGSPTGRSSTINYNNGKFNRYAKLGSMADDLILEFIDIIKQDPFSIDSRCSYACLLMMLYGIRIGNEDSAEGYESGLERNKGEIVQTFGTTTLQNQHIEFTVEDDKTVMWLDFLGKEQVEHSFFVSKPFLVEVGRHYYSSGGPDDKWLGIDYGTLFRFVKLYVGSRFVPKDMRTFCANITAWRAMQEYLDLPQQDKISDAKKELKAVIEVVAARCGNTLSVARNSYLDKRNLDWFVNKRYIGDENK